MKLKNFQEKFEQFRLEAWVDMDGANKSNLVEEFSAQVRANINFLGFADEHELEAMERHPELRLGVEERVVNLNGLFRFQNKLSASVDEAVLNKAKQVGDGDAMSLRELMIDFEDKVLSRCMEEVVDVESLPDSYSLPVSLQPPEPPSSRIVATTIPPTAEVLIPEMKRMRDFFGKK
ncbi:hypothetical protein IT412_03165 [Candidatus Peregrinibacteria bacterium]|nr:hypothetical protein [Candidatus Peregrinibacteria bacterium]